MLDIRESGPWLSYYHDRRTACVHVGSERKETLSFTVRKLSPSTCLYYKEVWSFSEKSLILFNLPAAFKRQAQSTCICEDHQVLEFFQNTTHICFQQEHTENVLFFLASSSIFSVVVGRGKRGRFVFIWRVNIERFWLKRDSKKIGKNTILYKSPLILFGKVNRQRVFPFFPFPFCQ